MTWLNGLLRTETDYRSVDRIVALFADMPDEIMPSWFTLVNEDAWRPYFDNGRLERVDLGDGKHGYRVKGDK